MLYRISSVLPRRLQNADPFLGPRRDRSRRDGSLRNVSRVFLERCDTAQLDPSVASATFCIQSSEQLLMQKRMMQPLTMQDELGSSS